MARNRTPISNEKFQDYREYFLAQMHSGTLPNLLKPRINVVVACDELKASKSAAKLDTWFDKYLSTHGRGKAIRAISARKNNKTFGRILAPSEIVDEIDHLADKKKLKGNKTEKRGQLLGLALDALKKQA